MEQEKKGKEVEVPQTIKKQEISYGDKKNKLNTSNALLAVVGVLILLSAVQVFQVQGLVNAISSGVIKTNSQTAGGVTGLPSQVGGCG